MAQEPIKVLFVCLGNICRSPTAEAVMTRLIEKKGLSQQVQCDSAGTSGQHRGEFPDPRSMEHAGQRGYKMDHLRSRPFNTNSDFDEFQYILAMDNKNYQNLLKKDEDKKHIARIYRMTQFAAKHSEEEVPDPYYSGPDGFELVLDLLEDSCKGLLTKIEADHDL